MIYTSYLEIVTLIKHKIKLKGIVIVETHTAFVTDFSPKTNLTLAATTYTISITRAHRLQQKTICIFVYDVNDVFDVIEDLYISHKLHDITESLLTPLLV